MKAIEAGQWLRYWRNSLADSESGSGTLRFDKLKNFQQVSTSIFSQGFLRAEERALEKLFDGVAENVPLLKVAFRPTAYVLKQVHEHGKKRYSGLPEVITPLICLLWVSRKGLFLPASQPQLPRDLLAPQFDDQLTISSVEEIDRFLDSEAVRIYTEEEARAIFSKGAAQEEDASLWQPYLQACRALFSLCQLDEVKKNYSNQDRGYFIRVDEGAGGSQQILKLYDWLEKCQQPLPLLASYALADRQPPLACTDALADITSRAGHSGSRFPLAVAQRDALAQTLAMQPGEILAVNGPPGTGKTTFVLSVVASLWVEAARKEARPPFIIAASTNNQAVTNIIAAFGKDFEENDDVFSGRWLPEISSYGGYFPAPSLESEAAEQYQTVGFYRSLENDDYRERAESEFLRRARIAFSDENLNSVQLIKETLWQEIENGYQAMERLQQAWRQLASCEKRCTEFIGVTPAQRIAQWRSELSAATTQIAEVEQNLHLWQRYCAEEPLLLSLLDIIPAVARKRQLKTEVFVRENFCAVAQALVSRCASQTIASRLTEWRQQQQAIVDELTQKIQQATQIWQQYQQAGQSWLAQASPYLPELSVPTLADVDSKLDRTLRFRLFQLAVHYWEARWLLDYRQHESEGLLKNAKGNERNGLQAIRARWARRMSLTPCIVSTLHSLPGHMTYSVHDGSNAFHSDYLINEIDLLIVDEAGQVAPEIAAASFALAKRALVIGDVHQIKPVASQTPAIDIGNMLQHGLLKTRDDYLLVNQTGRSVVEGSAMRIAQQTSRYHYLADAEPGMFLREHRRCFDEIISFCNDLCYQSLLMPMRGSIGAVKQPLPLPAMGYLHIDGFVESPSGGSRYNQPEADTIARWLVEKRAELEDFYQAKLEEIVGIVTPFKAQERTLTEACQEKGIVVGRAEKQMTIGTVHALQGAERKIVIFSPVYSRHNDGEFIDRDEAMLNVAVSRAKDSFLVFGDMDVIGAAARGTPRHLLADYLFRHRENELLFPVAARRDLLAYCPEPKVINNAAAHDACLAEILTLAQRQVDIVSPWLSYYWLEQAGIISRMQEAVARNITVTLYTDYRFNVWNNNQYDADKDLKFKECCEQLSELGIGVTVVNQVHSKLLIADDGFICIGSFNWGSAQREGKYKNMETSLLYSGALKDEITVQREFLQHRIRRKYPEG